MNGADLPFLVSGCSERDMGQIAEILPKQSRMFVPRWGRKPTIDFDPIKHGGLVILGDGKYWATSVKYERERKWLEQALAYGRPVLGICYGAQLLAAYFNQQCDGRALSRARTLEHGGMLTPVAVEGEGKTDPVVGHLAEGAPVIQSHEDTFQEPLRATALVWSKEHTYRHCEAFRVGSPEAAVYGLQFHPEPTLQMLQSEKEDERWFESIPPRNEQHRAVRAGEEALRAWFDLATARIVGRLLESN
jgi:GMP synthase-like glutamine amidotransferase